ncbi:glycosyltransferase family 2 protein [Flavobacterium succinicans]|uniref:UDP-Glc:alpha-D-GlcNAc-diphosphoundecaprenol beta-1,3-glucosyltransferase WfgD n=1 Tax=Flavobacterium succinicans TaxID=29536 RepID=A0A199XP23_9FLAO|nr:glycosyltransferase family 2 protein [Flavobacterium succinicans]OAZ03094.1 UDP-Glc:alpha-D-GlcNAc-diphosphoundecaprenol beta-1,3-glucosyltransferase WfgD [Flavobacterium succinicans]
MEDFFVSVIIPTYNRANDLDRCLKSLQNQTYKNFEVLVCDDGSTDNTKEVVDKFSSLLTIQYIKGENFGGPARPRNNGIQKAKGDIIAFLDSDDWWYPNKLAVSLPYLKEYDLVHHELDIYKNGKSLIGRTKSRSLGGNYFIDLIVNGNAVVNSSVVIKKEIVDLVGDITEDKKLIAVEDYDYWIRVAKVTNRFKFLDQSHGGYWVGENISYSVKQIGRARCLLDKYLQDLSVDEQKSAISLYNFNSARMYHYLSLYSKASESYLESLSASNLIRRVKATVGYIYCRFRIK